MTARNNNHEEEGPEVKVGLYRSQSLHYLDNAKEFLARQEFTKASEFLWGAVAQAVKAVAASNGVHLAHHGQVWDYAEAISREQDDPAIFQDFRQANTMHVNFYEAGLPPREVIYAMAILEVTVEKLLNISSEEASRQ